MSFIINVAENILGEVFGDAAEVVLKSARTFYNNIQLNKELASLVNDLDNDTDKKIADEVSQALQQERDRHRQGLLEKLRRQTEKLWDKIKHRFCRDGNGLDVNFAAQFTDALLFNNQNYIEILSDLSVTFKDLNDEKKQAYAEFLHGVVQLYLKNGFSRLPMEMQMLANVLIEAFTVRQQNTESFTAEDRKNLENILKNLKYLSYGGGGVSLQEAALSSNPIKYVLNACPGCGYDGPMIYVDDKTNNMYCAACGCSYHVLEYAEPDCWKEVQDYLGKFLQNQEEQNTILNELKNGQQDNNRAFKDIIDLLKCQNEQVNEFKAGFATVVTQQYLTSALNGQNEDIKENANRAANDVKDCFKIYMSQILKQLYKNGNELNQIQAQNEDNKEAVLDAIAQVNAKNAEYNEILCEKMDSLGQTINEIGKYVIKKTEATQQNTEVILKYVQQLCTKEMLDSMRDFLINSQSTLMSEMGDVRNEGALTRSEIAKIASRIDDVVEEWRERERVGDTKMKEFWENKIDRLKTDITIVSEQIRDLQASHDRDYACMITLEQENAQKIDMLAIQNMELAKSLEQVQAVCKANADMLKKNHELFVQARQNELSLKGIQQISSSWDTSVQNCYDQMGETFKDETDSKNKLSSIINKLNDTYEAIKGAIDKIDKAEVDFIDKLKELERRIVLYQHQDDCPHCGVPKAMEYTCNICGGHGEQNVAGLEVRQGDYEIRGDRDDILVVIPTLDQDNHYEISFEKIKRHMETNNESAKNISKILINSNSVAGDITILSGSFNTVLEKITGPSLTSLFENLKHFAIAQPSQARCGYQIKGEMFFSKFKDKGVRLYGMQYVNKVEKKVLCELSKDESEWDKYGFIQSAIEKHI